MRGAVVRASGRQLTSREQKILVRKLPAMTQWVVSSAVALFAQLYWRPVATVAGCAAVVYFITAGVMKVVGAFA